MNIIGSTVGRISDTFHLMSSHWPFIMKILFYLVSSDNVESKSVSLTFHGHLVSYLLPLQKKCFCLRTYVEDLDELIECSPVFGFVASKTLDLEKNIHIVLPIVIPICIIAVVKRRGFTGG